MHLGMLAPLRQVGDLLPQRLLVLLLVRQLALQGLHPLLQHLRRLIFGGALQRDLLHFSTGQDVYDCDVAC